MKTDAKPWTSTLGSLYLPSKSEQTLCETQSQAFAVRGAGDCENTSDSLLSSQPQKSDPQKYCAKRGRKYARAALAEVIARYEKPSANGKRWLARIYQNGKAILLGTHDTEEQAARAYDAAALRLFGPDARLNAPSQAAFTLPAVYFLTFTLATALWLAWLILGSP